MARLYAGTSGYAYPTWRPLFYPAGVPQTRFLEHYAGRLPCVEINYTFRHTPAEKTLRAWAAATPPGFLFAVKAHQRITHTNRLKEGARAALEYFVASLAPLREAERLGPVLLQMPPTLRLDRERLARFLEWLPLDVRFAVEFRDPSWFTEEVYDLLRRHEVALCVAESAGLVAPDVVTAGFTYYRMRKPPYDESAIRRLRRRADDLLAGGLDVFVVFKHEEDAGGALDAESLLAA